MTVDAQRFLRELQRQDKLIGQLYDDLFENQINFIDDPARFKAACCTRRAGKSYCAGSYLLMEMKRSPGCNVLFIATTLKQAKRILFKDIIRAISKKHRLGITLNHTEGVATMPNNSQLYLMGMDADKDQSEKVLGQKFRLVVVDEGASYKQDLRHIIYYSIVPTLADLDGTICLMGTTGDNLRLFYDVTGRAENDPDREKGWSVHKWSYEQNPHMRARVAKLINDLIAQNPLVVETPWFRQMYQNEWIISSDRLVYKFREDRNSAKLLPIDHIYSFVLTVDLGFEDDTAFVISAHSPTDPAMYFVEAYKQKHMDITAVASMVAHLQSRFKISKYVIDGAAKQSVAELRGRFHIPFEATDKQGKSDIIEIMNADLTMGNIKVLPAAQEVIFGEWRVLTWDPHSQKRQEDASKPNHGADAALYGWRMCHHYNSKSPAKEPLRDSDAWMDREWQRKGQGLQRSSKESFWMRDWSKEHPIRHR